MKLSDISSTSETFWMKVDEKPESRCMDYLNGIIANNCYIDVTDLSKGSK